MNFSKLSSIKFALIIAAEYYSKETYNHAIRVAGYIASNDIIPEEQKEDCFALAIMHDLFEDTEYDGHGLHLYFSEEFINALKLLTKPKNMDYIRYIKDIKNTQHIYWKELAYWVKLADMKDHLAQRETLTDRLKEKYLNALPYLL